MLYDTKNPHGGDIYGQKIRLDYSANTNPYGTPEAVLDAVRESLQDLHHYPDPYCRELVSAIAAHEGVDPSFILCGNGAADLIYLWCRAVQPKRVLMTAPTFSEYALGLENCEIYRHILRVEDRFDLGRDFLERLETLCPDAVFLCSPNNPTGRIVDGALLDEILERTKDLGIRLFLDECFLDLTRQGYSMKDRLAEMPQLTILKAFTKSYGMAGLRLGYCMTADRALLTRMGSLSQPWNVSTPAQRAGIAALREDAFLKRTVETVERERAYLKAGLEDLGFTVIDSVTNYLLFHGSTGLRERLLEQGIAIRDCANYPGLEAGWYRIAVRLREENTELLRAMAAAERN